MVIVVTGGIGSGKSEVCRIISRKYALPVYSADSRVRQLYGEVPGLLESLESLLACSLKDSSGNFRPALLAERIFADRAALKVVEDEVFPHLLSDFRIFCSRNPGHVVFESATVLEKEFFSGFGDVVILVDAPLESRVRRACLRGSADRNMILSRVNNQSLMNAFSDGSISTYPEDSPYGRAYSRVDFIIRNDGNLEMLEQSVTSAVDAMLDTVPAGHNE